MQFNQPSNVVFLYETPYEYEKILIEDALLEANVLFNIAHPIPSKGSVAIPILGPWSFYVRDTDLKKASEIIRTLPLSDPSEHQGEEVSGRERKMNQLIFFILVGLILIFLYLSLR